MDHGFDSLPLTK